jgi:hypothetical protein
MQKPVFESLLSEEVASIVLPPSQRLQAHNLALWFLFAAAATRFCSLCDWPLDPWIGPSGSTPDDRCSCCCNMIATMYGKQYWRDVETQWVSRRRGMGLE